MKFNIEVDMPEGCLPNFLGMLKGMEDLGARGASRTISIAIDGDGACRWKFDWDKNLPEGSLPTRDKDGDKHWSCD